jgi:hypothetical protein
MMAFDPIYNRIALFLHHEANATSTAAPVLVIVDLVRWSWNVIPVPLPYELVGEFCFGGAPENASEIFVTAKEHMLSGGIIMCNLYKIIL